MNSSVVPGWFLHDAAQRERSRPRSRSATAPCRRPRRCACAPSSTRTRCRPRRGSRRAARASRRGRRPLLRPSSRARPSTTRRIVEWPTRKPAFGASVPSIRSRYSPKRAPVPRHAFGECGERHAFDAGQHPHQVVAVLGSERRDREAAVAADHGRDAVQRRRRQRRVPEHLGVVVRVDVDESGRDDLAVGVDRARRLLVDVADRRDPAVADSDVGDPAGRTRAVDDRSIADDHVEHDPTIVQPPWVMHLPVGLPSSPGRRAALARRSRDGFAAEGAAVAIVARSLEAGLGRPPRGIAARDCGRHRRGRRAGLADRRRSVRPRAAIGPRSSPAPRPSSVRSTCSSTTRPRAST